MSGRRSRFLMLSLALLVVGPGCRERSAPDVAAPILPAPAPIVEPVATQPATLPTTIPVAATQPTGATSPQALMDEVIDLLEQKQYEQVFRRYLAPEDLEYILQKRSMQELMANYLEVDALYLRETLEQARSLTPVASDGGDTLTYRTTIRQPLILVRRDGMWYIQN